MELSVDTPNLLRAFSHLFALIEERVSILHVLRAWLAPGTDHDAGFLPSPSHYGCGVWMETS